MRDAALTNNVLQEKIKEVLGSSKSKSYKRFEALSAHYKKGMWLYLSVIQRLVKIDADQAYKLLKTLEEYGVLKRYYKPICCKCHRSTSECYDAAGEMPHSFECECCGFENVSADTTISVYKVL